MNYLDKLQEVDHKLLSLLQEAELNAEEIVELVDTREQILQNVLNEQKSDPGLKDSPDWRDALVRTKQVVELMQSKTSEIGAQLKKFRHGSRSIQRYQQFL